MATVRRSRGQLIVVLLGVIGCALTLPGVATGAADEWGLLAPILGTLKKIDGPVVWTSYGWSTVAPGGSTYRPPYYRGGFGLRYTPQRARRDSLNPKATVYDTTTQTISKEWKVAGAETTLKVTQAVTKATVPGPFTISIGYMADNGMRFSVPAFSTRLRLRGPYAGVFFQPDSLMSFRHSPQEIQWFIGVVAAFLDVAETAVHIDTSGSGSAGVATVKISSTSTIAPEFYFGGHHDFNNGTSLFGEISWQYVHLSSVSYSAGAPQGLPNQIGVHALHLTIGVTFSGSGTT